MDAKLRGFTFIEIMVVVIILGIAAAAIVPMMGDYDSVRVSSASKMVVADMSYAQNAAMTTQKPVYVLFNNDGTGYQVLYKETPLAATDYVTRPGDGSQMSATFAPSSSADGPLAYTKIGSVKHGTTAISGLGFDAQGQPLYKSGGSWVPFSEAGTVGLTNLKGSFTITVTIQPITGLVNIPQ